MPMDYWYLLLISKTIASDLCFMQLHYVSRKLRNLILWPTIFGIFRKSDRNFVRSRKSSRYTDGKNVTPDFSNKNRKRRTIWPACVHLVYSGTELIFAHFFRFSVSLHHIYNILFYNGFSFEQAAAIILCRILLHEQSEFYISKFDEYFSKELISRMIFRFYILIF